MKNKETIQKLVAKKLASKKDAPKTQKISAAEAQKIAKSLINESDGMYKIAQAMRPFVKRKMDYQGIARNLAMPEDASDGAPLWYEKDFEDTVALKIAENGSVGIIDTTADRVFVEEFFVKSIPLVDLKLIYTRTFKVLDRLKTKTEYGLRIKEDLLFIGLVDAAGELGAANGGNEKITTTGGLTRRIINRAMQEIEKNRLKVNAILCNAYAISDVRSWKYEDVGPVMMQKILESGYAGTIYGGVDWYVTDQISLYDVAGTDYTNVYVLTTPEYLAWIPYRFDVEVEPIYLKMDSLIGFVGLLLEAIVVHNPLGVEKIEFVPNSNLYT